MPTCTGSPAGAQGDLDYRALAESTPPRSPRMGPSHPLRAPAAVQGKRPGRHRDANASWTRARRDDDALRPAITTRLRSAIAAGIATSGYDASLVYSRTLGSHVTLANP